MLYKLGDSALFIHTLAALDTMLVLILVNKRNSSNLVL